MPASMPRAPQFRVHKPTNQAYVFVGGHRVYLGCPNKPETIQKYHQYVAELLASGGLPNDNPQSLTIKELVSRFWIWAENYYVNPDGKLSVEIEKIPAGIQAAVRAVRGHAGRCVRPPSAAGSATEDD